MARDGREAIRGLPRFHVHPEQITGGRVNLEGQQAHKAANVLRLKPGHTLAVADGSGDCFLCRVVWVERGSLSAEILERFPLDTEPQHPLVVCQAVTKGEKLDTVVRACTEAGATAFRIFASDRCVSKWDADRVAERLERLRVIARDAAEVSLRARVPDVLWAGELATAVPQDCHPLLLYEGPNLPTITEVEIVNRSLALVVGPEGGFADREVEGAIEAGWTLASLGPRVFRTEHAAFAALCMLLGRRLSAGDSL